MDDPEWDFRIKRYDYDVYHSSAYVRSTLAMDAGQPFLISVQLGDSELLLPLIRRQIGSTAHWDAQSPYGYGGWLSRSGSTETDFDTTFESALEYLRDAGCVSVLLRTHPLLNSSIPSVLTHPPWSICTPTVAMDLSSGPDIVWTGVRAGVRRDVRRTLDHGLLFRREIGPVDLSSFAEIYLAHMVGIEADHFYRFSSGYFSGLAQLLASDCEWHWVERDGEILATSLVLTNGERAHYHLAASTEEGLRSGAAKVLIVSSALDLQERNHRWFHLGGGRGGREDSLFDFKRGFGSLRHEFRSFGVILDPIHYEEIVASRGVAPSQHSGRFPGYRD